MANTDQLAAFSEESLHFLKLAGKQKKAEWIEKNDLKYEQLIRLPLVALAASLKKDIAGAALFGP